MGTQVAHIDVEDPGAGHRLAAAARTDLRDRLRQAARSGAGRVLVSVRGDAWHHGPEVAACAPDQLAQPVVSGEMHSLVLQVFSLDVPVLVQLDGAVSGLGLGLSMAADLRLAGPSTSLSLGAPDSAAALVSGATWLLERAVGTALLSRLAWTGEALSAHAAAQAGLVLPTGEPPPGAKNGELAADRLLQVPAAASSALKRALNSRARPQLQAALDYESWLAAVAAASPPSP